MRSWLQSLPVRAARRAAWPPVAVGVASASIPAVRSFRSIRSILAVQAAMLLVPMLPGTACPATNPALTPLFDLRVRQEVLQGVYHFAPEVDRNWIRVRSRVGGRLDLGVHRFELRLCNENRHFLEPGDESDWDELILDRGFWAWEPDPSIRLTAGRQDIIWPGGFLLLEGHPLDGSRSIYQDGVRLQWSRGKGSVDGAFLHNRKVDPIVLIDDPPRPLADADEFGFVLRLVRGAWAGSFLYKTESDPDELLDDLTSVTWALRREGSFAHDASPGNVAPAGTESPSGPAASVGPVTRWHVELAVQYQDGAVRSAADQRFADGTGWACAGEAFVSGPIGGVLGRVLGDRWEGEVGAFGYSGSGGEFRPFRAPWGRWPKWSELYIYSLVGESTRGRVHVAAWEDVAGPRIALRRPLPRRFELRVGTTYLLSPARGEARGLLSEARLTVALSQGLEGHLLWESLVPGPFHDGRHRLPALDDTVHFLRWQISWTPRVK